jgi:hypothetical protein
VARMSIAPITDIRLYSPFRTPAWRWQAATDHVRDGTRPESWEDPGIAVAWSFLQTLGRADTDLKRNHVTKTQSDLAEAHAIYIGPDVRRDELEARLLCEPIEVIAGKMAIPASVITAYAEAFFDVLQSLDARDWLREYAVRMHSFSLPPTEGECWRSLAFIGDPFTLDLVISDHLGRAHPEYPDRHEFAEEARFRVYDHASLIQTGNPADPKFVAELCRRYLTESRRTGKKLDAKTAFHLKCLRFAAGLPKSQELERFLPGSKRRRIRPSRCRAGEHNASRSPVENEIIAALGRIPTHQVELKATPAAPPSESETPASQSIVA